VPVQFRSFRNADFNRRYFDLPKPIRELAVETYRKFCDDPYQHGLRFKKLKGNSKAYSIRVGLSYRAVGMVTDDEVVWFWIGSREAFANDF
jgi:hypothetical protein